MSLLKNNNIISLEKDKLYFKHIKVEIIISLAFAIIMIIISNLFSKNTNIKNNNIIIFISNIIMYIGCCGFIFTLNYIIDTSKSKLTVRKIATCLPFILVALNNFPFISLIKGEIVLNINLSELILFILMCTLISCFEEIVFRKIIFTYILRKSNNPVYSILISSLIFALLHLANLISGSSILQTILQIGYSFLVGAMLCVTLLISNSILLCIIIHTIYNILGLSINYFATDYSLDIETIILTIIISVFALIWGIIATKKLNFNK